MYLPSIIILSSNHIAISACNFRNSSSSSSSWTGAFVLPLTIQHRTTHQHQIHPSNILFTHRKVQGGYSRSPFAAFGILVNESATGTVPVFSIFSSKFSCSSAARSASSSSSSMGSVMGMEVMALPISWVSSCCSRSCSLECKENRC